MDFFEAHREGVIGSFTTRDVVLCPAVDSSESLPSLKGSVWLAPYDLGVSQEFRILLSPLSPESKELQASIELHQASGETGSWVHLNKAFLSEVRRRLLGWRGLSAERIAEYVSRSNI
jgi:hypothetical protein